ncbi:GNAT family N-acetyltransferase [Gulosibacter macacae]|uniref:GNAT family N-acetyltransferase n=1 Tax=Gulosibacter macacae TaxID=2488791 RepID=A0A3P3VUB9_9MICO|nr:GNAT family N-acetyltransferase [Gulosibacter macacae]RRJ86054.1 GNAT family N-acetyltransferase [Gulosibacter macacae]
MSTRMAIPEDATVVASLLFAFNQEFDTWVPPIDVLEGRFTLLLQRADVLVLLADDPEPVGFALVTTRPSPYYDGPVATLDELYVTPARRDQGLGTELIDHLIREARARNIGEVQINVDEDDLDTRRFYEERGFTNHENGERMLCYLREL